MILWVDIETTGLEPKHDDILEVALVQTDDDLNIARTWNWTILPDRLDVRHWAEHVREMHANSGLLNEVVTKGRSIRDVEDFSRSVLRECYGKGILDVEKDDLLPMAGSSVHFDREFLKVHLPGLWTGFSHRNIDVSSIRELVKRWRPDVAPYVKGEKHRAVDDVLDSISELRYYKELFFDNEPRFEHRPFFL